MLNAPVRTLAPDELEAVAANAAEASRTLTIKVDKFRTISVTAYLKRTAASDFQMAVKFRVKNGGLLGVQQSVVISAGTGTLSDYTRVKAVSGDVTIGHDIIVDNYYEVQLVFSATSGGASDLISAQVAGSN